MSRGQLITVQSPHPRWVGWLDSDVTIGDWAVLQQAPSFVLLNPIVGNPSHDTIFVDNSAC